MHAMKKVLVIGSPGSGKSTFSRRLRELTGLPLFYLDLLWHKPDKTTYSREEFDRKLGELLEILNEDDLLIISADHGTDPTYTGTDHTREKVPFLAYSKSMKGSGRLPEQETFAVIGATAAENFGVPMPEHTIGQSLLKYFK